MTINRDPDKAKNYLCDRCGQIVAWLPGKRTKRRKNLSSIENNSWRKERWRHINTLLAECDVKAAPSTIEIPYRGRHKVRRLNRRR